MKGFPGGKKKEKKEERKRRKRDSRTRGTHSRWDLENSMCTDDVLMLCVCSDRRWNGMRSCSKEDYIREKGVV